MTSPLLRRTDTVLRPDSRRVLFRPFQFGDQHRFVKIIGRVMGLTEEEVDAKLAAVWSEFGGRHQKLRAYFQRRYEAVAHHLLTDMELSVNRQQLIGSYFTHEYALESAALFNPSMVWDPDQSDVPAGSKRFIVSLRATGEGHISSLCFRRGTIDQNNKLTIEAPSPYVTTPHVVPDKQYDRESFRLKLAEVGIIKGLAPLVLGDLPEWFTLDQLAGTIESVLHRNQLHRPQLSADSESILNLAKANYEVVCLDSDNVSENCIFPYSPHESNGIEDARFVEFVDEGKSTYYATYTAYDGRVTFPQLLETQNFCRFKINTLNGAAVANKGMALFPRKVRGHYASIGRQDGENLFLMYSENLLFWHTKELLVKPTYPWEFVQIGNCGSPLETEAGWLLLSHGVGPMRKYSIGAYLLDLEDPSKVIGRLKQPLLDPNENEREGYVPNVVYSCGALIHGDQLILPYAMADYASAFAIVDLPGLLNELTSP